MDNTTDIVYYDFVNKKKIRRDERRVADWVCVTCEDKFTFDSHIDDKIPELLIFDHGVVVCHACVLNMFSIIKPNLTEE